MALSDEMKELLAALTPAIKGVVDAALTASGVGALAVPLVDAGVAAIEAHNASYYVHAPAALNPGIAPVIPTALPRAAGQTANAHAIASAVALAMGNAPLSAAVPQVAALPDGVAPPDNLTLFNLIVGLAAKVEALAAATGMQTSAAMAAHAPPQSLKDAVAAAALN